MAIRKFEHVNNLDQLLSSTRANFEKAIWDAYHHEEGVTSREFRDALFNYIFWLEDTLDQHFQVGLKKDYFDLHRWKKRRSTNLIGQNGFHFEEPGGYPLG
jgi:hypothetical protein